MTPVNLDALEIGLLAGPEEHRICARFMAGAEPWLTIGRDYAASLEIFEQHKDLTFVARLDGAVVGFVILQMEGALPGYIKSIAVDPALRGQGIGRTLIAFAEDYILARTTNVFLCVSSFNPRAHALYTKLGYQLVGRLTNLLVDGHDELLLRKTIGPLTPPGPP